MRLIKYTLYIPDEEDYGAEEYITVIEQHKHIPTGTGIFLEKEIETGCEDWHDNHPLNIDCEKEAYEKFFE